MKMITIKKFTSIKHKGWCSTFFVKTGDINYTFELCTAGYKFFQGLDFLKFWAAFSKRAIDLS